MQALGRHLDELQRQHAQVDTEWEGLLGQLLAAQAAAQEATAAANAELTEREQAHRAAEDRWLREVDRARQEALRSAAALKLQNKAIERMAAQAAVHDRRLRDTQLKLAAAEARANALLSVDRPAKKKPSSVRGRTSRSSIREKNLKLETTRVYHS